MSRARNTTSGFCNGGAHEGSKASKPCPQTFQLTDGRWVQWSCQCKCHKKKAPANIERTGK